MDLFFQVLDHNVTKLGEKGSDHWAIHAQLTGFTHEKADNLYENKNMSNLQMILTERSSSKRQRRSTITGD